MAVCIGGKRWRRRRYCWGRRRVSRLSPPHSPTAPPALTATAHRLRPRPRLRSPPFRLRPAPPRTALPPPPLAAIWRAHGQAGGRATHVSARRSDLRCAHGSIPGARASAGASALFRPSGEQRGQDRSSSRLKRRGAGAAPPSGTTIRCAFRKSSSSSLSKSPEKRPDGSNASNSGTEGASAFAK